MKDVEEMKISDLAHGQCFWLNDVLGQVVLPDEQAPVIVPDEKVMVVFFVESVVAQLEPSTQVIVATSTLQLKMEQMVALERSPREIPPWDVRYAHSTDSQEEAA